MNACKGVYTNKQGQRTPEYEKMDLPASAKSFLDPLTKYFRNVMTLTNDRETPETAED
jgi:hypothetical protein